MSSPVEGGNPIDVCRRKALKVSVAALCSEVGYGAAEDIALETLTEMLQSCKNCVLVLYISAMLKVS